MGTDTLTTYKKYYDLEGYLFDEVRPSFHSRTPKHLTPFEFLVIASWKSLQGRGVIEKGLKDRYGDVDQFVCKISKQITLFDSNANIKEVVGALVGFYGFGVPMSSAFLTVLYPNDFTIIDRLVKQTFRERGELQKYYQMCGEFRSDPAADTDAYSSYVAMCKIAYQELGFESLRQFDKALWGYAFYKNFEQHIEDLRSQCVYTG